MYIHGSAKVLLSMASRSENWRKAFTTGFGVVLEESVEERNHL